MSENQGIIINLKKTHDYYNAQIDNWDLFTDCYKGKESIQDADDGKYLIKRSKEKDDSYKHRKKRAKYYNYCEQIISIFQGHLWRRSPNREKLPSEFKELINNIDRNGLTANAFFSYITEWAQVLGLYFVLVDYPKNPVKDFNRLSETEQKKLMKPFGLRPYFCKYHPKDLLDWGFRENPDGSKSLIYIVIKEKITLSNEPFLARKDQIQYKLMTTTKIQIWEFIKVGDAEEPKMIEERENTLGEIPIVPFYGKEEDFAFGKSAIHNIADLALEFYNKHSDRDHAEFMSAFPIPFYKMCSIDGNVVVGEGHGIASEMPEGDFKFVEFTGNSINALKIAEDDITKRMHDLALKQIRSDSAQRQTAESKRLDRLDATSELQKRAVNFEESENKCWYFTAKWLKKDLNKEQKVEYNLDFNLDEMEAQLAKIFLDMTATYQLSTETLWEILKRGELLPPNFDPKAEIERIESEMSKRSMPGFKNEGIDLNKLLGNQNQTEGEE